MSGVPVRDAKRKLKQKFSYAKQLDDSEYFGDDLKVALTQFQVKKNAANKLALRTDGVLDWSTQVALGVINPNPPGPRPKRGVILTLHGTGVSMWDGYPADTARRLEDLLYWQPCFYPATPFPMKQSYDVGINELVNQCRIHAGKPKILAGYSQGAIVTSRVLTQEVFNPAGRLHDLKHEFVAGVTWGNPDRELGVAHGNRFAGWPVPQGRGITQDRLANTPSWWLDFAHGANSPWKRDLYTDVPDDDAGEIMQAMWKIIENVNIMGVNGLLEQFVEMFERPLVEIVALFRSVLYAGMFFFSGTGPHISYNIEPAVQYLRGVAKNL